MRILSGVGKITNGEGYLECENEKDEAKGPSKMKPRVLLMTDIDKVGGNMGNWDMIYMFIYGGKQR